MSLPRDLSRPARLLATAIVLFGSGMFAAFWAWVTWLFFEAVP